MMRKFANAIRFLSMDMVQKANSGHPGMPMGMADVATILYKKYLKFNPQDPLWHDRDRFILSAGHGSALQYSILYLTGYQNMTLEQLKNFRQLGAITAGHPELHPESGIETTTGPLGQGLANAVGMAIAEKMLKARYGKKLGDHKIYVICGDGCLMEGISQEAISLAGHLKLNNLVVLFDDNNISIDGDTNLTTSENHILRFRGVNWKTMAIDGHDYEQIDNALHSAQKSSKPVFIACKTKIAWGAPTKAGTNHAHGSPLGEEEIKKTREALGWQSPPFEIPSEILNEWRAYPARNLEGYKISKERYEKSRLKKVFANSMRDLSTLFIEAKKELVASPVNEATRASSKRALELVADKIPQLVGGSADLTGSNLTKADNQEIIFPSKFKGSYIHYGVREHLMAAAMNGLAISGFIPYGGTFLSFTDYARPAIRLSALMKQRVIYVMTHDSIGLGEDGPTHQPVEHLAALRAMPNLYVFRPADVIETLECWELALQLQSSPSILALSRQGTAQIRLAHEKQNLCAKGAYIIKEFAAAFKVTIFATGTEVKVALDTAQLLEAKGFGCRVVSVPCKELFYEQDMEYQMMFSCNSSLKVAIEAGVAQGWERIIGSHGLFIGMETYGASAPIKELYEHFGITAKQAFNRISELFAGSVS
ncbi:MAG: transketolase [Rickettsiales bacterium]